MLNTLTLSAVGIVSPTGSMTRLEFILTNLVRYDLLTNVEIFAVQYGANIDFTPEQYAAITLSAQPQIGTRISNQDTFDYAPYQFSAGSYTPSVVFTVTFPVPVDIFDLAAATY